MAISPHLYYYNSKMTTIYIINITSISALPVYGLGIAERVQKTEILAEKTTPLKYWILCPI